MTAKETKLLKFIANSSQFVIPIYQRTYSWTEPECFQLWQDIVRAGKNEKIGAHFIGSVVYVQDGNYSVTIQSSLLVIDGQQRLTTVVLLLAALSNLLDDEQEIIEDFSKKKLTGRYLIDPLESGDRKYKLILSQTDKDTLIALINKDKINLPKDYSLRVKTNYEFFENKLAENIDDLETICKGIAKLLIVDISLDRQYDNPQLIFESMNSTGKELTQADLIRNYILMDLEHELQSRLYKEYWRPMELDFGQEAYQTYFDAFMRHYLTVKTKEIPKIDSIYEEFKKYHREENISIELLVADIKTFSQYFCKMALGQEKDKALSYAFKDLKELKVDVAYPLLLEFYDDYENNHLSKDDFEKAIRLIESYVFRRAVCAIPTNSLNKTFANFTKSIKKDRYLESIQATFMLLTSYKKFPTDSEFKLSLVEKNLYNMQNKSYWLRRFENFKRKEKVNLNEYTIEHIMPQNKNLSKEWQNTLGENWQDIQAQWIHTIGNLTLTGYNSEYSDKPFEEKRDMEGGFAKSPLKLNEGLGDIELIWNEDAIKNRGKRLSNQAIEVWKFPELETSILETYKAPKTSNSNYTMDDHPNLLKSQNKKLFEELRKEVLSLDSNVTEEFLKLYIAYKAETNFVDIVPQANSLKLYINIALNELEDPKKLGRDVSNIGTWGNGDTEVILNSTDGIPYIIGLVRQALEKQLGNDID
ncbi:DUF262 and DUF1524 domain-containing protein [Aliarcobacter lanthieri]|uniref:DUF262 and DUF1524 domain-containing protein n=1 Tax=Aliarcobacter lanthieri TaxID=1355374 RepID=UPI00047C88DA|nr:DUF262 and DUF1524 domain-containing protein [Aliarcobacter lanthieri]QKF59245.1 DUF262 and DUF1524 domain-containing protein [Aliarcobacter lanthieri]